MTRVDYCIPTINRPRALERILFSLAAHRPEASVHVADQSEPFDAAFHEELAGRLRSAGLRERPTVHRLPFDCGVSLARNHLVDSTPSEYKLVVDDDGVFTERTDVDAMVRLLDAVPQAGAVAGTVTRDGEPVFFGHRLEVRGATLRQVADHRPYEERDGVRFKQVDCLPNCALMRRELFDHVRWDPDLKTAAEHFDFYLRMKETPYAVLYAPDVVGEHPPLEIDTSYRDLRLRGEFVKAMMRKHDLTAIQMLDGTVLDIGPDGELRRRRGAAAGKTLPGFHVVRPEPREEPVANGPTIVHRGSGERAEIALTFDDGPARWTEEIAGVFERHGCRATFFLRGAAVADLPEVVAALAAAGHELGNHLWSHPDASTLNRSEIRAELERTAEAVEAAGAPRPELVRPPYFRGPEAVAEAASESGVRAVVLRSIGSSDWQAEAAEQISEPVLAHAAPGDIVCLHDGVSGEKHNADTREPTVNAVRHLVPALLERGLRPVTVSQLLGGSGGYRR